MDDIKKRKKLFQEFLEKEERKKSAKVKQVINNTKLYYILRQN